MNQDFFDWLLLFVRWLHITVAVTWIGTSIFFMWLDRTFEKNPASTRPGHVGELWMVHGGGFYHVEKLLMGPTKVPEKLHWFKWESYWTWMSGMMLMILIFYWDGTFLLDESVSAITHTQGVLIGLFSLIGSWFFYDFLWERKLTRDRPLVGHVLTLAWLGGMSYFLCHTLSGRAAYMHIGGMMGTWMTANVFMRIIPRQIKMVEAAGKGEPVNQDWGKNAKNRSTHNTYFTLPVIFTMLSNHFPNTYGHDLNWLILLLVIAGGAAVREYFVVRLSNPKRSMTAAVAGVAILAFVVVFSSMKTETVAASPELKAEEAKAVEIKPVEAKPVAVDPNAKAFPVKGVVNFEGTPPENKKLTLPSGCGSKSGWQAVSNEVLVHAGKLENVVVVIKNAPTSNAPVPSEEIVLDQQGCMYHPRVVAARVGQKVTFVNSDMVFHNVRSVTSQNEKFNVPMPKKDQRITKIFTKPEMFLQAKCSVHPWMGAYVAVMEHPWYSVSNEKGEFSLPKLPVGKYTIEAWHEVFGTQTQEIDITDAGAPTVSFTFKGKP